MRTLMMSVFLLGFVTPTLAEALNERDRGNQWFQNCEEEIARPFCGSLKITLAVESLAWQWQKQLGSDVDSLPDGLPKTSYLSSDGLPEARSAEDPK